MKSDAIDIDSIMYYMEEMSKKSQNLCVIKSKKKNMSYGKKEMSYKTESDFDNMDM
jgi:hypothetical protein